VFLGLRDNSPTTTRAGFFKDSTRWSANRPPVPQCRQIGLRRLKHRHAVVADLLLGARDLVGALLWRARSIEVREPYAPPGILAVSHGLDREHHGRSGDPAARAETRMRPERIPATDSSAAPMARSAAAILHCGLSSRRLVVRSPRDWRTFTG
jgi:hypothetical protein